MDKAKVRELLDRALEQESAFLIDFSISSSNVINVSVDTLEGITLKGITAVSRMIEHNLDREVEDFELSVSSPGVGSPLLVKDQYIQNIGRDLKVKTTNDEEFVGELLAFEEEILTLQWEERVPKEVGKGKVTVKNEAQIALADVKEAKVQVRFN
ncbi:MAG: ribosome assembly cofactor RimP [Bacteroidetes bacterium]|nr:MAG: ribosome assembly cofactor RimP [Bacteroidota bacterium]